MSHISLVGENSFVRITDLRGDVGGYQLTVQASPMKSTSDASIKINGSNITLESGTAVFATDYNDANNDIKNNPPVIAPKIYADAVGVNGTTIPELVATASPIQGQLIWDIKWKNENINLTVQPM